MTRTQFLLALLLAAVLGFGVAIVARGGWLAAGDRLRDTAAALKKMYRERPSPPAQRQQLIAPAPAR
ncbi:hypothetical protein [Anaeromyxobacter diazotrophicus]|uniref:Uncharacterized protein n=1 Tax=Anaeromyxobacter diazotrophicus TaxID=2590199 RepID=A0A7I9VRY3_9BACT|nr:hypothetical protein [Anaeromyxobacter diazotrophicus]GEJ59028.1 hypothetical protein AMYX_37690 [Anaeromyxobacter diazotrophicus]